MSRTCGKTMVKIASWNYIQLTLMMTSAPVVETSVNVITKCPSRVIPCGMKLLRVSIVFDFLFELQRLVPAKITYSQNIH